jgi:hypothetical protein
VDAAAGQLAGLWYCESIGATSGTFTITITHAASSGNYSIVGMIEANGAIQLSGTPTSTNQTGGTGFTLTCPAFSGAMRCSLTAMTVDSSTGNNIDCCSSFASAMIEQDSNAHVSPDPAITKSWSPHRPIWSTRMPPGQLMPSGSWLPLFRRQSRPLFSMSTIMRRNALAAGRTAKARIDVRASMPIPMQWPRVVYVPPDPIEDTRRNRPGRGPYSLGAYFRPRIDAFTDTTVAGINGTLSATLGTLTLAATSTLDIFGTLSQTLGALTTNTATATLLDTGASAITLQSLSLSSTGQLLIQGTLNLTLDGLGISAQAGFDRTGTLSVTLDSLAISSTGALDIVGDLTQTLDALTVSATNVQVDTTTRIGGDDVPRAKHHLGWNQKRSRLKLKKEQNFAESLVAIYRELTEEPVTKERAEDVVAAPIVKRNDESEAQYDRRKAERENAFREDRLRQLTVEKEIALRMLHLELKELQQLEDERAIEQLLAQVL